MEKMLDLITGEVTKAFIACGYDEKYARVTLSNRPDLCEYQCNGALALPISSVRRFKCRLV